MRTVIVLIILAVGGYFAYSYLFGGGEPTQPESAAPTDSVDNPKLTEPDKGNETGEKPTLPPVDNPSTISAEHQAALEKYRSCLSGGDSEGARAALAVAWRGGFDAATRNEMKRAMIELNQKLLYAPSPTKDSTIYVVQQNDNLYDIARKLSTADRRIESLQVMHFNRMKSDRLQPNQTLKIPLGAFRIVVRKSTFTLTLYYSDTVVKEYPVAVGKDDATPEGTFKIAKKIEKPDWDKRNDETGTYEKIKYGDPKNVLGERWMGFENPFSSYGIHGTNDDAAIGTTATKGCVRMHNNDVIELYAMVAALTDVTIVK